MTTIKKRPPIEMLEELSSAPCGWGMVLELSLSGWNVSPKQSNRPDCEMVVMDQESLLEWGTELDLAADWIADNVAQWTEEQMELELERLEEEERYQSQAEQRPVNPFLSSERLEFLDDLIGEL
jgi:hypothetical protein